jgi:hypothetical protein
MKKAETFFIWGVKVDLWGKPEVVKELRRVLFAMDDTKIPKDEEGEE